jgi:hypothetical protein
MDNTLRDDTGFAASRAGNDEQRSIDVFNRLELFRVELQHENNQVTRRWSKVESGVTGEVPGFRIRDSGKNHKRTCLNPVLPTGIREEPRHSDMLLTKVILASARALSPMFSRAACGQDSGFGIQGKDQERTCLHLVLASAIREEPLGTSPNPESCIMVDL